MDRHYKFENKTEVLNTEKALAYKLAETTHNEIVHLCIENGGEVPAHALDIHVTFYIVNGEGKLTIDNEVYRAKKGDIIEVSAHKQRSWFNASHHTLELLVIKQKIK